MHVATVTDERLRRGRGSGLKGIRADSVHVCATTTSGVRRFKAMLRVQVRTGAMPPQQYPISRTFCVLAQSCSIAIL